MNRTNEANDLNRISDEKRRAAEEARRLKLMQANARTNSSSYMHSKMKNINIEIDELEIESPSTAIKNNLHSPIPSQGRVELPLDLITTYEFQVRKAFDEEKLNELAQDIKKRGVQTPIKVFRTSDNKYAVYNGERRFRASYMAGLSTIPAIITSESDALVDSFQDNEKRENLNILSRALYFQLLIDRGVCIDAQAISDLLSVSINSVYEGLSYINKIPRAEFDRLIQIPNIGRAEIRKIIKSQRSSNKEVSVDNDIIKMSLKVTFQGPKATIIGIEKLTADQIDALVQEITNHIH